MDKKEIGNNGEDYAEEYLISKGYIIEKRNFNCRYGELDIVANDKGTHVFVEVKTRKSVLYGMPSEAVTYFKQQKIRKAAFCYLKNFDVDMRFDVIEIIYSAENGEFKPEKINHIENAF